MGKVPTGAPNEISVFGQAGREEPRLGGNEAAPGRRARKQMVTVGRHMWQSKTIIGLSLGDSRCQ